MIIHDYSSALAFLLDRINYERTTRIPSTAFRLDRMRELLSRLGDPHLRVPVVHVAGTKGKGSTATMIAAILQAAGYRTGLYTSPHLERIEERFAIDGQACSPQEFVDLTRSVAPVLRELDAQATTDDVRSPTFFEITTAMAFVHFVRRPVDIAVLEVGLGGRLDSTNVCQPLVSVITSISFDHMRQLGNTLAAIAREKAGIIKPGVPVISGVVDAEPRNVIHEIAAERDAPLRQFKRDFDATLEASPSTTEQCSVLLSGSRLTYHETEDRDLPGVDLNLPGEHQATNAAIAIAAIRELGRQGWNLPDEAIRTALVTVRCPGRVEVMRRDPTVVVDTAHNVASIEALCRTLRGSREQRRVLVFASSRDKDVRGMLRLLLPEFDDVIVTRYVKNPRARAPEALQLLAKDEANQFTSPPRIHQSSEPHAAWQLAQELAGRDGLICITGSFFLAAELRAVVLEGE